jgi:hypothetical protein
MDVEFKQRVACWFNVDLEFAEGAYDGSVSP